MCVIFFYATENPSPKGLKLIVASNRDEFYERETLGADKWEKFPHVVGGIDLQPGREGGSWLAIGGKDGVWKLGALLNVTGEPKPKNAEATYTSTDLLLGRGMIVTNYVTGEQLIEEYNKELLDECEKYTAFNFVAIELKKSSPPSITLCSNAPKTVESFNPSECYGCGNSPSNAPFQKVVAGRDRFETIVNDHLSTADDESSIENLVKECFRLLKDQEKHWPDNELKSRAPNWGNSLSSLNVSIPEVGYGSRTHTVILVGADDKLHFYEETMKGTDPSGEWNTKHIVEQYFQAENGHCTE